MPVSLNFSLARASLLLLLFEDDCDAIALGGSLARVLIGPAKAHMRSLQWHLHDDEKHIDICEAECAEPGAGRASVVVHGAKFTRTHLARLKHITSP